MSSNETTRAKVLGTVRKLLNLAEGDGAADLEIQNAMNAAARLIAQHQIEQYELEAEEQTPEETRYARDFASFNTKRAAPWMGVLGMAIARAVGSVQCYGEKKAVPKGAFGRVEVEAGIVFYGPDSDVLLAKDLFAEWLSTVATLALGRYGGFFTGPGREYAYGFASALYEIGKNLYKPEAASLPGASAPGAAPASSPYTLARVEATLVKKKVEASAWLRSQGVRLGKGSRPTVNFSGAYAQGRADGRNAGFGVTRTKALGSGK